MEMVQAVFYTSSSEKTWRMKVYDIDTGSRIVEYCGDSGAEGYHMLSVANGCILEAQKGRAKINVWPLNKYNSDTKVRLFAPGKIDGFAATDSQKVLAYSVKDTVYFYQTESGQVHTMSKCHYLPVNVIKFSCDECFVACGAEDGMVSLWNLGEILRPVENKHPLHLFTHHLLPVTDLAFTALAHRLRLVTVSEDRTVKVYDVATGTNLLSVVFETSVKCVALPSIDISMYIGQGCGTITEITYSKVPEMRECHVSDIVKPSDNYIGHSGAVINIAVTNDTMHLVSGSSDGTVRIWDNVTRHCLHIINDKGSINSILVDCLPKNVFRYNFKPMYHFHPIAYNDDPDESFIEVSTTTEHLDLFGDNLDYTSPSVSNENDRKAEDLLRDINKELYDFSVHRITDQIFVNRNKDSGKFRQPRI